MLNPIRSLRLVAVAWLLCFLAGCAATWCGAPDLYTASVFGEVALTVVYWALFLGYGPANLPPLIPAFRLPDLPKGGRVAVFGIVALGIFFGLPSLLRLFDPTAGGFAPDTVNAAALGAFHYFAALSMAYASWRWLFPNLYQYAVDCMEGKLLENLTDDLKIFLTDEQAHIMLAAERRHIAQFQFLIRCVRFIFSLSPFVFFLILANHALTAALTAVPAAAPGL